MEGEIDTNKNSVANYQRFTETEHILRIRLLQIGDLVGNLSAGLMHSNIFYV